MFTTLSQDLCAEAKSLCQGEQHVCNVASWASGPLRKPSLVPSVPAAAKVSQWVHLVSLSSPVLCGAMCLAVALLATELEQFTHAHTLTAAYPSTDVNTSNRAKVWGLIFVQGGGKSLSGCSRVQNKGIWHLVSFQPNDMINCAEVALDPSATDLVIRFPCLISD